MGASPRVVDWDNDGRKDLIVGESYGKIHIFLNTGTDADPVFSGSTFLQVGGSTFDCGERATPEIVDWNNDGKKDLLTGDDQGKVRVLINTGSDAAPSFASAVYLQDGATVMDAGTASGIDRSSPVVVDWNKDGKKDLLSGRATGGVVYWENKGTDAAPVFSGKTVLRAGGAVIDVGSYARIEVYDWDNDGDMDLLVGNRDYDIGGGWVYLFRAAGSVSDAKHWQLYR